MKLLLREDWDIPIHPPVQGGKQKGYFIGREKELWLLSSELSRRDSGAILVTGYRGVGKTSLVYKAITNVQGSDKNVLPVFISASQLHDESAPDLTSRVTAQNPKRLIIESIIRRLYATARDDTRLVKFQPAIEDLYKKAVAAKFELTKHAAKDDTIVEQLQRERVSQINIGQIFTFVFCGAIALLLLFLPEWSENPLVKIASLLIAVPVPLGISYLRRTIRNTSTTSLALTKATEVYQFDTSIGNLEFDLEKLHRDLSSEGKKLIYVIDELDKLDTRTVGELLKFFKNLFTLSEALFIFIADEQIYGYDWTGTPAKGRRPVEYTYFTSRYFLSRPTYGDLREYLQTVAEASDISPVDLEKFFRAVCFVAENDFFDLRSALTDRITYFDRRKPVIEMTELSSQDEQSARFHTVFTSLFERKYMALSQSKWHENDQLQASLFRHLKTIQKAFASDTFQDPDRDDIDSQMIRDCNALLTRIGAFKLSGRQAERRLRGIEVSINLYSYTGVIPEQPPEELSEPSEFERRYITGVERYYEYVRAIRNAFRAADYQVEISNDEFRRNVQGELQGQEWNYNFWAPVSKHFKLHQQFLTERPLPVVERSDIEERTKGIEDATTSMLVNGLPTILAAMLIELYPVGKLAQTRLSQQQTLFADTGVIHDMLEKRNPICVFSSGEKYQVAIVGGDAEDIRRSAEQLRSFQETHRIILVGDFGEITRRSSSALYFVNTNNPDALKASLTRVLRSITAFWSSKKSAQQDDM